MGQYSAQTENSPQNRTDNALLSVEVPGKGLGGTHVASGIVLMLEMEWENSSSQALSNFWDHSKTWRWPANISIS